MPVEVLLADEREVLPRRHAEARAERPAELARAAKAATPGDVRQRALNRGGRQKKADAVVKEFSSVVPSTKTGTNDRLRPQSRMAFYVAAVIHLL